MTGSAFVCVTASDFAGNAANRESRERFGDLDPSQAAELRQLQASSPRHAKRPVWSLVREMRTLRGHEGVPALT